MQTTTAAQDQLLYRPEDAARLLDIGRSTLFELLASGEVPSVRIGRSRRVPRAALEAYVERLSCATHSAA